MPTNPIEYRRDVRGFPHITTADDAELFELAAPLDDQGTMLSLLWIPGR